ncbi:recombinase family protein [Candidatus Peregrinibacteria bacterium]|nr:recombinase family protein [Candidatus Peregrinibacteria bacterium]
MKKAIILARVSTKEQEETGLSIDKIQMPQLREYAKEHGIQVVEEFVFQETACQKLRKKFDEMIEFVKANDEVKIIIGFRVDRLTRNYRDAVEMDVLRTEYNKELHFVSDRLVLTAKSYGRDIQDWDMKVFLAKQHINRCQEDTYNTQQSKLRNMELYGKAQFGYRNAKDEEGRATVVVEPFEAGIVRYIFDEYTTGASSYQKISQEIESKFRIKMGKSKVEKIIRHPFYMGQMLCKGQLHPHKYQTLITEELYEIAKEI